MGLTVVEQWRNELAHCLEWGNPIGVERAVAELRALGVDVDDEGQLKAPTPKKRAARTKST